MNVEFDVRSMLGLYLDEAHEQLDNLESSILSMIVGEANTDAIAIAFRTAHTLKGASTTMGYDAIGGYAHDLEDRLERLRNGDILTGEVREALLSDTDRVRKAIHQLTHAPSVRTYRVTLDPNCVLFGVRAELLFRELAAVATIAATRPSRDQLDQAEFELDLESEADEETLSRVALAVPEVRAWQAADRQKVSSAIESTLADSTIRVPVSRLDLTARIASELVIERARIQNLLDAQASNDDHGRDLRDSVDRMSALIGDLHHLAMGLRMVPIEGAFRKMIRLANDLAIQFGKSVQVLIEGGDAEVDRTVHDALGDPLIHIVRNCLDHGIESPDERLEKHKPAQGTVRLSAIAEDGEVILDIEDDGRGIDAERVRRAATERGLLSDAEAMKLTDQEAAELIFESGFSTATEVSEVSGRGVGMDIVRSNIEKFGGRVSIDTEYGRGTRFRIVVPVSMSVARCLVVGVGGTKYAIPEVFIQETRSLHPGDTVKRLIDCPSTEGMPTYGIVVRGGSTERVIEVDQLIAEAELVVKPLPSWLGTEGITGAAIGADGDVLLIVDPNRMLDRAA